MPTIHRFEELEAWQTARDLTRRVYALTRQRPFSQDFALSDQIRRASVSVLSNIAEGFESRTNMLFIEFLGRAKGSAGEVRAQLYVCVDAGYISKEDFDGLTQIAETASRQISKLMDYLKTVKDEYRIRELPPDPQ